MLKRYQHTIGGLIRVVDAAIMVGAWLASYFVRFFLPNFAITKGLPSLETYASLTPLIAVLWIVTFSEMGLYRRLVTHGRQIVLTLQAHAIALLLFIAVSYCFEDYRYSRLVMAYFAILGALALTVSRITTSWLIRWLHARGRAMRRVLMVGEGPVLEGLVARLDSHPELGIVPIGVITHESSQLDTVCGRKVLGHFSDIVNVLAREKANEVVIALPPDQQPEMNRLLELLKDETVDVRVVPDIHRFISIGCEVESFANIPVVHLNDSPLFGWAWVAKRSTDIIVSGAGLIVLSPLLLLIGLAVKLTSRGPVLYAQERMGFDGGTFPMLKFRSMRINAESETGAVWARANDDRRTPIGALLRRTSLDELPQLLNAFLGHMSLVGPRPERPVFVQQFRGQIPFYNMRHKVKAGITGWAQINGWRGNTSLDRRIECDLFYIRNWSYMLDLKILVLTLWKGLINKNAY